MPAFTSHSSSRLALSAAALAVVVASWAPRASDAARVAGPIALRPAGNCADVRDRLIDIATEQLVQRYRYWTTRRYYRHIHRRVAPRRGASTGTMLRAAAGGRRESAAAAPRASVSDERAPAADGPRHYTRTNVQERNVDEADLIKTNGKHIFTVRGNELLVVQSWPPRETSIIARYPIDGRATRLFLKDDRLAVFSAVSRHVDVRPAPPQRRRLRWVGEHPVWVPADRPAPQRRYFQGTRVTVLDVQQPAQPRVVRHFELEGQTQQALMIGSDVYVISTAALQLPPHVRQAASRIAASRPGSQRRLDASSLERRTSWLRARYRALLRAELRGGAITRLLPRQQLVQRSGAVAGGIPLVPCSRLYLPASGGQLGLLDVSHFDIEQPTSLVTTGLLAQGWRFYASTDHLYVATTPPPRTDGQPARDETQIHKFVLRGSDGDPEYVAAGTVPGQLLNQFSMSEHRGHLRVATTDRDWARGSSGQRGGNNLLVLRGEAGRLRVVGALRGLASGERIYAARMFGDKGYMVTFRQTDPLFTIDLSDPQEPRVVGELKVNGFSSYIHPLGKQHLLTIGQDADDNGRLRGMHLQIFDVSDFARPRRTHHYRFEDGVGYAHSTAQSNHHAFTYDPRTRVLAVPLAYNNHAKRDAFNGLLLLRVGQQSGFEQLARISHADLYLRQVTRACAQGNRCGSMLTPQYRYAVARNAPIQRSVVMDDYIYSLSNVGLQVHPLRRADQPLASLLLAPGN